VGNKSDAERQVSAEEVQQFVEDKHLFYYETSAKSGANVREMFVGVATALTERTPTAGIDKRPGTTLERTVQEQEGYSWRKNCYC
jgi:hypothetical protein